MERLIIDQVMLSNGHFLAYTGGVSGQYISQEGSTIVVGDYEDGCPYITDALFVPKYTVEYPDENAASAAALSACGTNSVINMMCGNVYANYVHRPDGLYKRLENGELVLVVSAQ